MEDSEIENYNKTIAIFMQGVLFKQKHHNHCFKFPPQNIPLFDYSKPRHYFSIFALRYDTSWDWLMPVYKKVSIELKLLSKKAKTNSKNMINKLGFLKRIDDIDAAIRCEIWGIRIEDTYKGIYEAILFINKYKAMNLNKIDFKS